MDYLLSCLNYNPSNENIIKDDKAHTSQMYIDEKITQIQKKLNITIDKANFNFYAHYLQNLPTDEITKIMKSFQNSLRLFLIHFRIEKTLTQESDLVTKLYILLF